MISNLVFVINFSFMFFISIISIILNIATIFIVVARNRPLRTFNNILLCNSSCAIILHSIMVIISSVIGIREDWSMNALLCPLRGYLYNLSIASIYYSKLVHGISHLFFAVLYKHRYLLTWRSHGILIVPGWFVSVILSLPPFFISGGFVFEKESRQCIISSKFYIPALSNLVISAALPLALLGMIHIKIITHVHRSTRRVQALVQQPARNVSNIPNYIIRNKREMKLIRQMFTQISTLISGGLLYIFLIGWHWAREHSPPEVLYMLALTSFTISISITGFVQFRTSKKVQETVLEYFFGRRVPIPVQKPPDRQLQVRHLPKEFKMNC